MQGTATIRLEGIEPDMVESIVGAVRIVEKELGITLGFVDFMFDDRMILSAEETIGQEKAPEVSPEGYMQHFDPS